MGCERCGETGLVLGLREPDAAVPGPAARMRVTLAILAVPDAGGQTDQDVGRGKMYVDLVARPCSCRRGRRIGEAMSEEEEPR